VRATLTPPLDGEYVFAVNCAGAGTLRIGGRAVLELGADHDLDWSYLYRPESRGRAPVVLEAGKPVAFELDYRMTPGPAGEIGLITLRAQPPEPNDLLARAIEAATAADIAVVFAGLGEEHECEGYDRSTLDLPREQRELIAAIAAANPRTVVVLSAGGPVALDWAESVPAILLVWYAGQELGPALGQVLVGYAEPGGRLPITLPARPKDAPVLDPAPDDPHAEAWHYSERIFVGYRHFDRHELDPAYCFGHGLGYTSFSYEEMHVERNGRDELEVTVRLRNRGRRCGKEVVQLYVGSEDPSRPPLELKAFAPIELDGEGEGTVTFTLAERAFSPWESEARRFARVAGTREIVVGSSSRDLRLRQSVAFEIELAEKT
jgi:beta-glucosidase